MDPRVTVSARIALLALLVVGAAVAGAAGGKLLPNLTAWLSGTPAGAAQLSLLPTTPVIEPAQPLAPVGTGFTYQGRLKDGANPANGQYDFAFSLHANPITSTLVSGPITFTNQTVNDGLFTLTLDFGSSAFDGDARFLQIKAKRTADPSYTSLLPRQPLNPAPYALFALKAQGYKNVIVVAQSGGDYTSIQTALDSITDNSFTNRYLVWVAPGTYSEMVTMKPYVNIEGAGERATRITYAGSSYPGETGTVVGSSSAELSSIRVENTGGDEYAVAIYNDGASPSLLHVTAVASGGTGFNYGIYNNNSSSPTMNNVTASASSDEYNVGVYNKNSSSPIMNNVTASGSGGGGIGVRNDNSSPSMNNVVASGSGGENGYGRGVYNNDSSSPIMIGVTASGTGGTTTAIGVDNNESSPTIENSVISGSGGPNSVGIYNSAASGTYTVKVNNSTIVGSTNTIRSEIEFTVRIGASQLDGGGVSSGGGTVTCAGVFDEAYTFFSSTCPP